MCWILYQQEVSSGCESKWDHQQGGEIPGGVRRREQVYDGSRGSGHVKDGSRVLENVCGAAAEEYL